MRFYGHDNGPRSILKRRSSKSPLVSCSSLNHKISRPIMRFLSLISTHLLPSQFFRWWGFAFHLKRMTLITPTVACSLPHPALRPALRTMAFDASSSCTFTQRTRFAHNYPAWLSLRTSRNSTLNLIMLWNYGISAPHKIPDFWPSARGLRFQMSSSGSLFQSWRASFFTTIHLVELEVTQFCFIIPLLNCDTNLSASSKTSKLQFLNAAQVYTNIFGLPHSGGSPPTVVGARLLILACCCFPGKYQSYAVNWRPSYPCIIQSLHVVRT